MVEKPEDISQKKRPFLQSIGWLITFGAAPFGSCLPGFPFLLISRISTLLKRDSKKNSVFPSHPLSSFTIKLFYLFLFTMFLSSAFSPYRWIALAQTAGFALLLYVFMFGGRALGRSDPDLMIEKCLPVMAVSSVIASVVSLVRFWINHMNRAVDLFTTWNGFGTVLIIVSGMAISYLNWRSGKWRYLIAPYLMSIIPALIVTKSRGGWFGFLTMLGGFVLFNRKIFGIIIIFSIAILLASSIFLNSPILQSRFLSSFSTEQNVSRVFIWRSTIHMIKDHPILGVGTGIFPFIYHKYVLPDAPEKKVSFAHNLFLQVMAEFGAIGFIIFCGIIFSVLYMSFQLARTGHPIYQGILVVLIGVLVHQQVDIPIWGFDIGGIFWMLVGLTIGLFEHNVQANQ